MGESRYYYCEPGRGPRGPLPIEKIRADVTAGLISQDVNLSTSPVGPWQRLSVIDFSSLRASKAKSARMRMVAMVVLLVLGLSGLCVWAYLKNTKDKTARDEISDASTIDTDAIPAEHHRIKEEKVWVIATNCLYYLHMNMSIERAGESLRISLAKQLSAEEARQKEAEYLQAKAKVKKSWDEFQTELERLQKEETDTKSLGRYSKAISDCKDYGIRLAINAARAADSNNSTMDKTLDEYERFGSLTLEEVLAGKYHGGYGEVERR